MKSLSWPNTGISELGDGISKRASTPFSSPNNLTYFLNNLTQYYTDTGATIPAVLEGDVVAAWKNASAENASQSTSGKRPTLNLSVSQMGGKNALLFTDDQTTPTVSKFLALTGILGAGLNTNFYAFAQVARNAGNTRNGYVMSVVNAADASRFREGNNQRSLITANYGTITMKTRDDDCGAASMSWDGTYMCIGWNNREQGRQQVNPATGPGFASGDTLRIGNYDDAAASDGNWIGKLCRPTAGALTSAQRKSERIELGRDMGLPNSGKGKVEILVESNSIGNGFGATAGWPSLLQTVLGTTSYDVFNNSTNSIKTKDLAQDGYDTVMPYGNWFTSILYKIDVGTSRTVFDGLTNAGLAPSWSVDQWAGWYVVFATGTNNKGYAGVVASNDANTLTLTSPGMPYTPTANDTFYLFKPSEQGATLFGVFHEMRNDLVVNGATEGPAAVAGDKTACLVYQRHVCACRALKAYGARLIGLTLLEDAVAAPYGDYYADMATIQGWMLADTEGLWDAYVGFAEMPEMTPFGTTYYQAGGPHPTDAGHAVMRAAIQAKIAAML